MDVLSLENELRKNYKEIFSQKKSRPDWAVKKLKRKGIVHPAIPFVGKKYNKTKVLLYASAENLSGYNGYLDDDTIAIKRRRDCYNAAKEGKINFPSVHIAPVDDGSLLIVSAYILDTLGIQLKYSNPYEFIEYIAVDNFCKYSLYNPDNPDKNEDYAGDIEKVEKSFPYIEKDLNILKPRILILPVRIYDHEGVKEIIKKIVPKCRIIPIYQINSGTINRIIRSRITNKGTKKGWKRKKKSEIKDKFIEWQENLGNKITGKTNCNFYSVYTYLDDVVKESISGT